jgi:hypothetical protein
MRPERMKAEKILNDFFDTFKKDPYASDSSDGEKDGLNAKFSPIDEQTNEKLLKKVEEFKKEDLKVDYTIKNSSNVVKEKQQDNVWSEIAYKNVSNGKLCVAKISSSLMLDSLLNLIPEDAWMTLFTETQRDQLRLLLPKMEEVEGLSKDELQQENLRLLFTGANFHFGNQLVRFNQEIQQGKRRLQVSFVYIIIKTNYEYIESSFIMCVYNRYISKEFLNKSVNMLIFVIIKMNFVKNYSRYVMYVHGMLL